MKIIYRLTSLLSIFIALNACGQYVPIDPTFANDLSVYNGLSGCIVGNQLDTTCAAVNSITSLDVSRSSDITGIEYFHQVQTIQATGGLLTFLPPLPESLINLYCQDNQITSIASLPPNLQVLNCFLNQLSTIPALPNSLISLDCEDNLLTSLPSLPNNLYYLSCSNNQLSSLPSLPQSLQELDCDHNQLLSLPPLDYLYILHCDSNPQLSCLPELDNITDLSFTGTAISCIPNYLSHNIQSNPLLDTMPLCVAGNPDGCIALLPAAAPDQQICQNSSAVMAAVGPGTWTAPNTNPTPVTFANPNDPRTTASGFSLGGIYTLIWTGHYYVDTILVTVGTSSDAGPDLTACFQDTIRLAATGSGTWSGGAGNPASVQISFPATPTATVYFYNAPGIYHFVWTNNGCTDTMQVTVHPRPVADAGPAQTLCHIGDTAVLGGSPTGSGGSGSYSYIWSPGFGLTSVTSANPTASPSNGINYYQVQVTDIVTGCIAADTMMVSVTPISVSITASPDTNIIIGQSAFLTANVSPSGGTFQWSPLVNLNPGAGNAQTEQVSPPATMNFQVIYNMGSCSDTAYQTIYVYSFFAGQDQTICGNDTVTMHAIGTGNWNALNSNPTVTIINTPSSPTTTISGFTQAGIYSFVWTTGSLSDTVAITVDPIPNAGPDQLACLNSTVTMAASGTGTWTNWAGSAAPINITNPTSATTTVTGFTVTGTYRLYWTSTGGCTDYVEVIVGPAIALSSTHTSVQCYGMNNGGVCVSASGGAGAYTYVWSPGNITVPCPGALPAGVYRVTVTDANGCTAALNDTITEPAPLTVTDSVRDVSCFGASDGTICLTVTGGTPIYTYVWSPFPLSGICENNLSAGAYSITITDANNCNINHTALVLQPTQIIITDTVYNSSCNMNIGSICPQISGGAGGYTYFWSNFVNTAYATSLGPGQYHLIVTDASGCTATLTDSVIDLPAFNVSTVMLQISCHADSNGYIDLQVSPTGVYHYAWNSTTADTSAINGLRAGNYCVTVTNALGCSVSNCYNFANPPPVTIALDSVHNV
ncbi:MAG: hypothetical protein JWO03_232, partial [Bacteroidetes bacterium]|nr:hypothetical protein [Bacteroidota bacterium]